MTEIEQKIESLHPWFYNVQIGPALVTPGVGSRQEPKELIARTKYRETLLVDEVVSRYDFTGKRLLDIAANCAYWSSQYVKYGASSVIAVEGRSEYIEQGKLYWGYNQILPEDQYEFMLGDVTGPEVWERIRSRAPYDFTLCCGILYHIFDHETLLTHIDEVTQEAVLIDTRITETDKTRMEYGDHDWDAIKEDMVKYPTVSFLKSFFEGRGYLFIPLKSRQRVSSDMVKKDNYDKNRRGAFLCLKSGLS
jgi:hypothetical protein